jgi:hypothetical protein
MQMSLYGMPNIETYSWDPAERLETEEDMAAYLYFVRLRRPPGPHPDPLPPPP